MEDEKKYVAFTKEKLESYEHSLREGIRQNFTALEKETGAMRANLLVGVNIPIMVEMLDKIVEALAEKKKAAKPRKRRATKKRVAK